MVDVDPAQHQSSSPSRKSSDLPSGGDTSSSEAPATLPQATTQSFPIASPQRQPQLANSVYELNKQREIIRVLHKCAFSPCKSTWITAIKNFQSWPGLSAKLVEKHLQATPATLKGHMRQQRMNIRSTKPKPTEETPQDQVVMTSSTEEREHLTTFKVIPLDGKVFSDQTGRFPLTSSLGSKYILILHDADTNSILAEPLKNRSQEELLVKQIKLHSYLIDRGHKPQTQILDNECPQKLKEYFDKNKIHFQLVPPHLHRTNVAERAIATFKDHLIAGLANTDPSFPLHLWDRLLPQAVLTLNLLRPARYNPRLSAWCALNGAFDFNATPLAPPGTKVQFYDPPATRKTWAPHSLDGFYLEPAMQHYRCYRCYIPATRSEWIARTVHFLPHDTPMPKLSSADRITEAARELSIALQNPHPASLIAPIPLQQIDALRKLSEIFNCTLNIDTIGETRVSQSETMAQTRVQNEYDNENSLKKTASTEHKNRGDLAVRLPPELRRDY